MAELVPPELLDHMRSHVTAQTGEDGSNFDDLDDDELSNYIANEKEVRSQQFTDSYLRAMCACVCMCVYVYVC